MSARWRTIVRSAGTKNRDSKRRTNSHARRSIASRPICNSSLPSLNGGPVNECDLVAKLDQGGSQSGYTYDSSSNLFDPDDGGAAISDAALRALAGAPGQEVTYTAAPILLKKRSTRLRSL